MWCKCTEEGKAWCKCPSPVTSELLCVQYSRESLVSSMRCTPSSLVGNFTITFAPYPLYRFVVRIDPW